MNKANLGPNNDNVNLTGSINSYTDFGGSDIYTISPNLFDDVMVTDRQASTIFLPDGLVVSAANFSFSGVEFIVNDRSVKFLGEPSLFTFVIGGNPLTGGGVEKSYSETAEIFGTTVPAEGEPVNPATQTGAISSAGTVGQTIAISSSANSVAEGESVDVFVSGADANSIVSYTITGVGVDASDVDALKGTIATNANGVGSATIVTSADSVTEGPETMTVTLDETGVSTDIVINDTSTTPPVVLTPGLEAVQGTDVDDLFQATVSPLPSENTLSPGDKIDGGSGSDTLLVDLRQGFTGFEFGGFLRNVEAVRLSTEDEVERVFNALDITGVQTYNLSGNVELVGLGSTDIEIALQDRSIGNTRIEFEAGIADGANDSVDLSLKDLGRVKSEALAQQIVGLDIADIETLNIAFDGTNVVELDTQDVKDIVATGVGFLQLTGVGAGLDSFDGSLASGNMDVDLKEASDMKTIRGGTGDDIIRTSKDALDVAAVIDGGEGLDILELAGPIGAAQFLIDNIETIALTGPDSQLLFSSKAASEVERVIVESTNADGVYNFIELGERTFEVVSSGNAAGTLRADNSGELIVGIEAFDETASTSKLDIFAREASRVDIRIADGVGYSGEVIAESAQTVTLSGGTAGASGDFLDIIANKGNVSTVDIDLSDTSFLSLDVGSEDAPLELLSVAADASLSVDPNSAIFASEVSISGGGNVRLGSIKGASINFQASALQDVPGTSLKALDVGEITSDATLDIDVSNVLGTTDFGNLTGEDIVFTGSSFGINRATATLEGGSAEFAGGFQDDEFTFQSGEASSGSLSNVTITGGDGSDRYSFLFEKAGDEPNSAPIGAFVVTITDFRQDGPDQDKLSKGSNSDLQFQEFANDPDTGTGGGILGPIIGGGGILGPILGGGGQDQSEALSIEEKAAELLVNAGIATTVESESITFLKVDDDQIQRTFFTFDGDLYGVAGQVATVPDQTLGGGEILFRFVGLSSFDGIDFA